MKRQKFFIYCSGMVILLAGLFISTNRLYAQLATSTATLSGTVTDPSGSVVPGATVTITSAEKGINQTGTTSASGRYTFSQLPPATYSLSIQMMGFKEYKQNGILLDAAQTAGQDVKLVLGEQTQQIVVTSQASVLNTDNANISADINAKQVVELPLNLRNIYGLAVLNSSVNNNSESQQLLGGQGLSTDDADQDISFLNFAGGFFGTSAYMLDGGWDTDPEWGAVIYVPSVDAVQEFKIQNNSFTAQYGWSTGNVVNVVTKSGTNQFHGDIYEFYRNSTLDANLWFNNHNGLAKPDFNRNQTGISAGGPLYIPKLYEQKEKTFIFGLYERLSLATPAIATYTVPDSNFRSGNFAELLGPQVGTDALGRPIYTGQIYDPHSARAITAGQVDPRTGLVATQTGYIRDPIQGNNVNNLGPLDALGTKLVDYYPTPTKAGLSNNLATTGTAPANSDEYLIRVDQNFNNATRGYFRYSYKKEFKTGTPDFWGASNPAGPGNLRPNNRYNMAAGLSHVFTPTFTMNIAAGVELWHENSINQANSFLPSTIGLPTYLDTHSKGFPVVMVGGQANLGPSTNAPEALTNHGPIGSVSVDFIKTLKAHTLSFGFMGVELEDDQTNVFQTQIDSFGNFTMGPDPDHPTANTGNGVAQLLLGVPDGGQTGTSYNPATAMHYFGGYLQDDWHAANNLTLNLGLRYEIQTAPTYRHNVASVFNPNTLNPIGTAIGQTLPGALNFLSSSNRGAYSTNYKNFAPRIGFTYQAVPKLVFRGGYGIFYPQTISTFQASASGFATETPIVSTLDGGRTPTPGVTLANPWPNGYIPITGNGLGQLEDVGYGVGSNFQHRRPSYVQQYMFGFQYGFTQNDDIEVNYVGNHGTHMLAGGYNRTQLNPTYLPLGTQVLNNLVANPFYGHIAAGQSGCGLDQATIPYAHLLQPYTQYCNVQENDAPVGFSNYNALQVNYNHRFNQGLSVLVSYTYSKFLDNVEGQDVWAYSGNSSPANNYNLAAEKSVDASDTPHSLVVSYIYDLPIGRGKRFGSQLNRATNAVIGGWEVSGISSFKQGTPLAIAGNNINSYGGNPRPDVIGPLHVAHPSIHEWFNTAAFAYAPYGTFGTAPRYFSTLRAPGYQNWDTSIMKNWELPKALRLQFRAELYNTFNHAQFYAPQTFYSGCDPNASASCGSNLGQITNTLPSREVQFAGKFYW